MPVTDDDMKWLVDALGVNVERYAKSALYYAGEQDLGFATPKFNKTFGNLFKTLAYNRCRPVVDALANALKVTGFQINGVDLAGLSIIAEDEQSPSQAGASSTGQPDLSEQALTLWRLTGMALREGELYTEAAISGDAYGVVYFDQPPPFGTGLPKLWPNKAALMRVRYDDDGHINLAAKAWKVLTGPDNGKWRVTFYTSTEITRLITSQKADELPKELSNFTLFRGVNMLGQAEQNPVPHTLGRVPVVHYANNAPMLGDYGISELKDVMPIQDALNKAIADMIVAMEYNAFPQRWATGVTDVAPNEEGKVVLPWRQGPGEIWYSTGEQAKFGDFAIGQLNQFLSVQDQFDLDIARVSSTPVHWLIMTGTPPSGEAIKTASAPFTSKIKDRQRGFGAAHADALLMQFQLMGITDPLMIDVQWESAEPRSQLEMVMIGKTMHDAGLPLEVVAKAMGLDDQDMLVIESAQQEERASQEKALAQVQGQQMANQLAADQSSSQPPEGA